MENTEKEIEYLFVFKNGGWWLKISSINELFDYHEKTDVRWESAFSNLIHSKEFFRDGNEHCNALALAIGMYGSRNKINALDATVAIKSQVLSTQLDLLLKGYDIYINSSGGYHMEKGKNYKQWYRKKKLIFPNFKKDELKIKKFPMGTHWYAYIGDMQLRDGDTVKWDKYEDAYNYAQQFMKENA